MAIETNTRTAPKGFIKKHEAAQILGCTTRSVDNWMKQELIPYYKFGRAVYFKEQDLLDSIEKCKVG